MSKVILITGGSQGLGFEIAKKLSGSNQVIVASTNEDNLKQAAKELNCDFLICDVTNLEQIKKTVAKVIEKYGRLDVLINNAGIWIEGELDTNDPDYIHRVLEVNTLGVLWFSRVVVPIMKKQKKGHIINIVSDAGLRPKAERTVYIATKYALTGFTDSLQEELAKYNIAVSGIYPSKIQTGMFAKVGVKKELSDGIEPEEISKAVEFILSYEMPNLIPMLRIRKHVDKK